MSNDTTKTKNRPTHRVFNVTEDDAGKRNWIEIGAAWPHKDGHGFNLKLDAPAAAGDDVVLRTVTAKKGGRSMSALSEGHITPGHVRVFQALRSPFYDNITLASCWVNGEPGVAIVMIDEAVENKVAVMPLFVAITPGMDIRFPGEGESDSGAGGPKDPREDFEAAAAAMCPSPS